jgi:hypothetical protein
LPICIVAISLLACSDAPADSDGLTRDGSPPSVMASGESAGEEYPDLYRDLDLPELPGGTVTSTGRQTTSLHDGLAIRLTTSMSVADARDYYSDALGEQGWEKAPSRVVPGAPVTAALLFGTKDGVTLMVTIAAMVDTTQITLNIHDR